MLKKLSFWVKLRTTIASLGIGSEVFLHFADSTPIWSLIAGFATILGILITVWIEDKNNDGIVDLFEDDKSSPKTNK
jgi:hypothetical protein